MSHLNRSRTLAIAAAAAAVCVLALPAQAEILNYEAVINGSQEVPPNESPATGTGTFVIDTDANTIDFNIVYEEDLLIGEETAAHIHCCAPPGVNAGVIIPLPAGSPKVGQGIYEEANEADILAGLSYVNIHTDQFPGGEIRGQIVEEVPTPNEEHSWGQIKSIYR